MSIQIEPEYLAHHKERYAAMTREELEAELAYLDRTDFSNHTEIKEFCHQLRVGESGALMEAHYENELLKARVKDKKISVRTKLVLAELFQSHARELPAVYMRQWKSLPLEDLHKLLEEASQELSGIWEILRDPKSRPERKETDPSIGSLHWRKRVLGSQKRILYILIDKGEKEKLRQEMTQLKAETVSHLNEKIGNLKEEITQLKSALNKAKQKITKLENPEVIRSHKLDYYGLAIVDDLSFYFLSNLIRSNVSTETLNECLDAAINQIQNREENAGHLQEKKIAKRLQKRIEAFRQNIQSRTPPN